MACAANPQLCPNPHRKCKSSSSKYTILVYLRGTVKQWGGSLVIAIDPQEAHQRGLKPGMDLDVELRIPPLDLAAMPGFDDVPTAADHHDRLHHESR